MSRQRPAPVAAVRRCAIYTRKSTTHGLDQEFSSLDAQWEACAAYVRAQPGYELVEERYDDGGFSGANVDRPAFQRLMRDVDEGRVDVVVVYKIDRLSRSLLDFASLMERLRKAGAFFISVTQPFLSADSDAMAQLLLNLLMAFAQFERQMIAERIRDKVTASRRKGLWTGGNVPFGYSATERRLVVLQDEALVVQRMFGLFVEQRSDAAVVRDLDARGTRTRTGRRWTPQAVARVLENPVYAGYVTLGEELHEGEHEPVVDRELFERVQTLRHASPAERASRGRNPEYLLRGLVHCSCRQGDGTPCGYAMTPGSTRKGRRDYRYYRCIARDKVSRGACEARPLPAEPLEELVQKRIAELARSVDANGAIAERVQARSGAERDELRRERGALRERIKTLDTDIRALGEQIEAATGATKDLLGGRQEAKARERAQLRERLSSVDQRLGGLEALVIDAGWIAEQLRSFDRVWQHLHPLNRLRVVRAVVERVDVDEPAGEVAITLQPWCRPLLGVEGEPCGERAEA
jgi:DNA invertase Pin-like site-specific DNA recombinase